MLKAIHAQESRDAAHRISTPTPNALRELPRPMAKLLCHRSQQLLIRQKYLGEEYASSSRQWPPDSGAAGCVLRATPAGLRVVV